MINTTLDPELLYRAKKYLDNGFNDKQTATIVDIGVSTVAKVRRGEYGPMPVFESDPALKLLLGKLGLEQMNNTLNLMNKRRKKSNEQIPEILNKDQDY